MQVRKIPEGWFSPRWQGGHLPGCKHLAKCPNHFSTPAHFLELSSKNDREFASIRPNCLPSVQRNGGFVEVSSARPV